MAIMRDFVNQTLFPSGLEEDRPNAQIGIEMFILLSIWCPSVIGNVLVCLVIFKSRRVQSTTNYFVVAMATVDLIFAIAVIPFVAGRVISSEWVFGDFMCRLVRFIQLSASSAVMYLMSSICIDRFYTILYPLSFKVTRDTAKRMIVFSYIMATLFSGFLFYFHEPVSVHYRNRTKTICTVYVDPRLTGGVVFTISSQLLQHVAPTLILSIIYFRIFRFIWKTNLTFTRFQRTTNHVPRTKVKMVKMLMIVTIGTVLLSVPTMLSNIFVSLVRPRYVNATVSVVCIWSDLSVTLYKPFIYSLLNSNFRRGCKEVFCMTSSKCYRSNTYAITTASSFGKKNHVGIMRRNSERALDSPTKAFDRSIQADKSNWPLSNGMGSTYI